MKTAVIVFPGSNCDRDVQVALAASMDQPPLMVWHAESELPKVDLIVLPGGFSYGDYLRSGAIAAHSPVMREVVARAAQGVHILGICNGFQILVESGLLPGALLANAGLKYVCRDVWLRVEVTDTVFTGCYQKNQVVRFPVAHHDGNYFVDDDTMKSLDDDNRVVFRYCTPEGAASETANPNGSRDDIAGVLNQGRNVLGMMPHPERLADPLLGGVDGQPLFEYLVETLAA